ncbi:hypothetical protein [Pseudescherichia vulneris]|uniref:Uncharacterized protein n=1 Tax=Pseudescherichia vulneris NBRC 102420 TaxID=1115515 RepID=A0A090V7L5_PSEVU|nr:hypothetical protein [Pseudescherichia vulneris]GAL60118.1 hypothetical protein EV102420_30_00050 [Pseudescherichia vulneris NBRC 102420]STQ59768.1 Uncharacterised protein [Pseudescherichia vulneris]
MFSFLNTLQRLIKNQQEAPTTQPKYSNEQLLQWATGCMLEGLPDAFYEARVTCECSVNDEGHQTVSVSHEFKLTAESEYARFSPPDDLYATNCIEQILTGKKWKYAAIIFNPQTTRFEWK